MRNSRVVPVIIVMILVVAVLAILVVLRSSPPASQPTSTIQSPAGEDASTLRIGTSNKEAVNQLIEAVNQDDNEALLSLLSSDFVAHIPQNPLFEGSLDASLLNEVTSIFHAAVPSLSIESEILVEEGDFIAQRALITGNFEGEFYDYPPNNNPIEFAVNVFYRFDESGKIAEQWIELDSAMVMQQFEIS